MTLKTDKNGKITVELTESQFDKITKGMAAAPRNTRTKEEIKDSLAKHYEHRGGPSYMQHMFDLDEEFPEVEIFGEQCISAEVGPGWNKLLRPVMEVLRDNGCRAGQIKQKWGGLRFYWDFPPHIEQAINEWRNALPRLSSRPPGQSVDEFYAERPSPYKEETDELRKIIGPIVAEAERLSYRTCEECGVDIGREGGPCYRTECDGCSKKSASGGRGSVAKRQE